MAHGTCKVSCYGVTSLSAAEASPRTLLRFTVGHWGIAGGSPQQRDVTFHEDFCDLRRGHSAHIMAILNNIAVSLIAHAGHSHAAHARRVLAADPRQALTLLTTG